MLSSEGLIACTAVKTSACATAASSIASAAKLMTVASAEIPATFGLPAWFARLQASFAVLIAFAAALCF